MYPAFQGVLAGFLQKETDTAVTENLKLHHAPRLCKIGLRDPEVANGVGISHVARFPPDKPGC
jgi:hypothetical protein